MAMAVLSVAELKRATGDFDLGNVFHCTLSARPLTHADLLLLASSCRNLVTLSLDSTQITNIAPLATLTHLTALVLAHNNISELTPLCALSALASLDLRDNRVESLEQLRAFARMPALTTVSLQTIAGQESNPGIAYMFAYVRASYSVPMLVCSHPSYRTTLHEISHLQVVDGKQSHIT